MNWERPGLSDEGKATFLETIRQGTGLAIIHFANGAFTDWPGYRQLARRVWVEGKSAHDPYGPFRVEISDTDHPITQGMTAYDTTDELYFAQQGVAPIEPLAKARSKVSGEVAPMAFAHALGAGRIFQTVLGHDAAAIRNPGTARLIRRGSTWAAGRTLPDEPPTSASLSRPLTHPDGRFGRALDPRVGQVAAQPIDAYQKPPLTVECWVKLESKSGFNLFVANGLKESSDHWEIYSAAGSGNFHAYLPGYTPQVIDSGVNIVDHQWHHVMMIYEPGRIRLLIDGKVINDTPITRGVGTPKPSPLYFGSYPPGGLGCAGLVDEVRITAGARSVAGVPEAPFEPDDRTIGLWHFDEEAAPLADASSKGNPAVLGLAAPPVVSRAGPSPDGTPDYEAPDPRLKVVRLDRSESESLLSIRPDSEGRLFVGGREGLFVYEPDDRGGYGPRTLLYRFPPDTWVTDIAIRGDDVYALTMSALYVFRGARTARVGLRPERLVWGLPVDLHVTFKSLAWGLDGSLTIATGDPLLNYGDYEHRPDHWGHWTIHLPGGASVPYNGQGGIFRLSPEGKLAPLAFGLRGPGGLAFDERGNLFTTDNDHESRPGDYVPARLLHVTEGADFQWPRGWMAEKTPDRADVLATMTDTLGREVPCGLAFYAESLLPEEDRGTLLMARWGQRLLSVFRPSPRGASFRAEEVSPPLLRCTNDARPVGVAVGRGGRVFATVCYMRNNEWSPHYVSDLVLITTADDPQAHPFHPVDVTRLPDDQLWKELYDPSPSRRAFAHQEILRRPGMTEAAVSRLEVERRQSGARPALRHLVWLAGASGRERAREALLTLASDPDAGVRRQAIRALGTFFDGAESSREVFKDALKDEDPAVVLAALGGLMRTDEMPPEAVATGPARSRDTYLRQTSAVLLARLAPERLDALSRADDPATRLAAVLAAGIKLTVPPRLQGAPEGLALDYPAENAKFVVPYADETVDLKALGPIGSFTIAELWKQTPRTPEQTALVQTLRERLQSDPDDAIRLQAAYSLNLLNDAELQPLVERMRRAVEGRRLAAIPSRGVERVWLVGPFLAEGTDAGEARPEGGPVDLSASYPVGGAMRIWQAVEARDGRIPLPSPASGPLAYYAYFRLQAGAAETAKLTVAEEDAAVWHNGQEVGGADVRTLDLQPGSNDILIRLHALRDQSGPEISYKASERVVATMPEKLGIASLAERLKAGSPGDGTTVPQVFLDVDWARARREGDAERGRLLFSADGLGCARCHAIVPDRPVLGGPSLAGAARRFTVPHVVESVLLPSQQVAPIFRATTLATKDGQVLSGLVLSETDERVELLQSDTTRRTIPRAEIAERSLQDVSPMPAGLVKTPEELRDLLAYLLSENPEAP